MGGKGVDAGEMRLWAWCPGLGHWRQLNHSVLSGLANSVVPSTAFLTVPTVALEDRMLLVLLTSQGSEIRLKLASAKYTGPRDCIFLW